MLGLVLLYVGAVLLVNGLAALGRIAAREGAVLNVFVGAISVAGSAAIAGAGTPTAIRDVAFGLLFGLTYLWVAWNQFAGHDGRGLGWFCGFVAVTAAAIAADLLQAGPAPGSAWLAACWGLWSLLWAGHFVTGALQRRSWVRPVAWLGIAEAVGTAWLPGYLLLTGRLAAP